MEQSRRHEDQFLIDRGYKKCYTVNGLGHCVWPDSMKAPNGKTYTDRETFYKEVGWYPGVIDKDGVCWNEYRAREKEGYIYPFYDECAFLVSKGYRRHGPLSNDYMHDIALCQLHYEKFGFVPRWYRGYNPDAVGHEQSLEAEGYVYPFGKSDEENLAAMEPYGWFRKRYNHPCD